MGQDIANGQLNLQAQAYAYAYACSGSSCDCGFAQLPLQAIAIATIVRECNHAMFNLCSSCKLDCAHNYTLDQAVIKWCACSRGRREDQQLALLPRGN